MVDKAVMERVHCELLEISVISVLSEKTNLPLEDALDRYYRSLLAKQIATREFDVQHMEASAIVDILLTNERNLFE